jgi:UDP-glucose 4-epimerase
MAAAAGVDAPPTYAPARAGELDRSCVSPAKAATGLGWTPQWSLEDGLAAVLTWFRTR